MENPDGLLRPGMFARVRLTDPHAAANGRSLVIPAAAVQRTPEGPVAFVQEGERTYERRRLRLGRKTPDYVEVLDGLQPAEPVVVQGAFLLKSEAAKGSMGGGHEH